MSEYIQFRYPFSAIVAITITFDKLWSAPAAKVIIPAIVVSFLGGMVAAVNQKEKDKAWGFWAGVRTVFVGVVAGVFSAFIIRGLGIINDWTAIGLVGFLSFLGQKVFDKVAEMGPIAFLSKILRIDSVPVKIIPPVEKEKDI